MLESNNNSENHIPSTIQESKLAAIKEIIFGQEQAELKHDLDVLKTYVQDQNDSLRKQLDEVNATLKDAISSLGKEVAKNQKHSEKEIQRINDEKANRKAMGKMLINIGEKLLKD